MGCFNAHEKTWMDGITPLVLDHWGWKGHDVESPANSPSEQEGPVYPLPGSLSPGGPDPDDTTCMASSQRQCLERERQEFLANLKHDAKLKRRCKVFGRRVTDASKHCDNASEDIKRGRKLVAHFLEKLDCQLAENMEQMRGYFLLERLN